MAIPDYSTLAAQVKTWCARRDSVFSAQIPTFVGLAEDRIYNGYGVQGDPAYSPPLRARVMEVTASITLTNGEADLPGDVIDLRKIYRASDRAGITYMPPERFDVEAANSAGGDALHYTVEGGRIRVSPPTAPALSVLYIKRFPDLTEQAPPNALLLAHSNIYLEAVLFEAFSFTQAVDVALAHAARCRSLVQGANSTAAAVRHPGPLRKRFRQAIS